MVSESGPRGYGRDIPGEFIPGKNVCVFHLSNIPTRFIILRSVLLLESQSLAPFHGRNSITNDVEETPVLKVFLPH